MESELIRCECSSMEHIVIFSYDADYNHIILSVHLSPKPLWQRILWGIRYILGYRSVFGDFDEVLIGREEISRMYKLVEDYSSEGSSDTSTNLFKRYINCLVSKRKKLNV